MACNDSDPSSFLVASDDFLLNVCVFGLHDQNNLHSFVKKTHLNIFTISTCVMCPSFIFPFNDIVKCINCCCIAHRYCARSEKYICPNFGFKNGITRKRPKRRPSLDKSLNDEPKISIVHSRQSLRWLDISREVMSDFVYLLDGLETSFDIGDVPRLEALCRRLLNDPASFPGRLSIVCRSIYMNLKFCVPTVDTQRCARSCLDAVAGSLVYCLEKKYEISVPMYKMTAVSDTFMLSSHCSQMYDRIIQSIEADTSVQSMDADLLEISKTFEVNGDQQTDVDSSNYLKLTLLVSPLDKCRFFLSILKDCVFLLSKCSLEESVTTVSADELIPRVALKIMRSLLSSHPVKWHVQCRYIESMCSSQEQWLLGEEGYALTTMMQALSFIHEHRSRSLALSTPASGQLPLSSHLALG